MPSPNLPPGFDFTDPDIYAERIPVDEFAELRASAPIWWNEQLTDNGGGFHDGGFWAVTKLDDVKEVSRRSDVFSSYENGVIPRFNNDIAREDIEVQRFVMLNMDAPHHTGCARSSRAASRRARRSVCARKLSERLRKIAGTAAAAVPATSSSRRPASSRCRRSRVCCGVPQEDRGKIFDWSNEMTGTDDPEFAAHRPEVVVRGIDRLRDEDGRGRAKNPATTS